MLRSHPDRPLAQHLHEVGRAAAHVLSRHTTGAFSAVGLDLARILWTLAGWHDLGKATSFFQDYIVDPIAFNRRARRGDPWAAPEMKAHTPIGAILALRRWSLTETGDFASPTGSGESDRRLLILLMMLAIRGHHTRLPSQRSLRDTLDYGALPHQITRLSPAVEACHPSLVGALDGLPAADFQEFRDQAGDMLEDTLALLKPGAKGLPELIRYRLAVQFCFSCLLEADKALLIYDDEVRYFGLPGDTISPSVVEDHPPTSDGSPELDRQRRDALDEVLADVTSATLEDTRPRTLTLPTGLGKTRCAAAWAFHWRDRIEHATGRRPKILIVLPFLSIIEQTERVYRRELLGLGDRPNDETLIVSHSLSARDYSDVEDADQSEFALDTWRSDVVLTTFDQFLMALMDARTKCQQRFHNLCDALIVLDEVQAFPCHLWHLVGSLIRELAAAGRTRFLLMTATQPGLLKLEESTPIVREPAAYAQSRYRLEYDPRPRLLPEWVAELAEEIARPEHADIGRWLIVLNTRRAAQEVFAYLKQSPPRERLFLLSSDIVPLHRLARIEAIRTSSSCVAVTTQCVEAGVNLDMDRVIRDFGPLDSLIQVAGRCNRHGLRPRATVRIVALHDDCGRHYSRMIYDRVLLDETAQTLRERPTIDEERVMEAVETYFRRLHKHKDTGRNTTDKWARFEHDDLNISRLLRGDQDRVQFCVGRLDLTLRSEVEAAYATPDRWQRRRALRMLASRITSVTVSAWKTPKYHPVDIADPVPATSEDPSFWFLHDDAYDEEIGLCPPRAASHHIF
jgi:CRISPR-associated endonuclease/helicase Cas3